MDFALCALQMYVNALQICKHSMPCLTNILLHTSTYSIGYYSIPFQMHSILRKAEIDNIKKPVCHICCSNPLEILLIRHWCLLIFLVLCGKNGIERRRCYEIERLDKKRLTAQNSLFFSQFCLSYGKYSRMVYLEIWNGYLPTAPYLLAIYLLLPFFCYFFFFVSFKRRCDRARDYWLVIGVVFDTLTIVITPNKPTEWWNKLISRW